MAVRLHCEVNPGEPGQIELRREFARGKGLYHGAFSSDRLNSYTYNWQDLFKIPQTCPIGCSAADTITFEANGSFVPTRGMTINSQFEVSHGVRFSMDGGLLPVLAEINVSPPPAFEGAGSKINRVVHPASKAVMQRYFLTMPVTRQDLIVTYSKPVKAASGYLFDIDNSERWWITPYSSSGNPIASSAWYFGVPDGSSALNGKATFWSVKRADSDIASLRFHGEKPSQPNPGASIAFDRFSPAKVCQ